MTTLIIQIYVNCQIALTLHLIHKLQAGHFSSAELRKFGSGHQ